MGSYRRKEEARDGGEVESYTYCREPHPGAYSRHPNHVRIVSPRGVLLRIGWLGLRAYMDDQSFSTMEGDGASLFLPAGDQVG